MREHCSTTSSCASSARLLRTRSVTGQCSYSFFCGFLFSSTLSLDLSHVIFACCWRYGCVWDWFAVAWLDSGLLDRMSNISTWIILNLLSLYLRSAEWFFTNGLFRSWCLYRLWATFDSKHYKNDISIKLTCWVSVDSNLCRKCTSNVNYTHTAQDVLCGWLVITHTSLTVASTLLLHIAFFIFS